MLQKLTPKIWQLFKLNFIVKTEQTKCDHFQGVTNFMMMLFTSIGYLLANIALNAAILILYKWQQVKSINQSIHHFSIFKNHFQRLALCSCKTTTKAHGWWDMRSGYLWLNCCCAFSGLVWKAKLKGNRLIFSFFWPFKCLVRFSLPISTSNCQTNMFG